MQMSSIEQLVGDARHKQGELLEMFKVRLELPFENQTSLNEDYAKFHQPFTFRIRPFFSVFFLRSHISPGRISLSNWSILFPLFH